MSRSPGDVRSEKIFGMKRLVEGISRFSNGQSRSIPRHISFSQIQHHNGKTGEQVCPCTENTYLLSKTKSSRFRGSLDVGNDEVDYGTRPALMGHRDGTS